MDTLVIWAILGAGVVIALAGLVLSPVSRLMLVSAFRHPHETTVIRITPTEKGDDEFRDYVTRTAGHRPHHHSQTVVSEEVDPAQAVVSKAR